MDNGKPDEFCLIVIDIQEGFKKAIPDFDIVAENISRLIRGMRVLKVPILVTEQNPGSLGKTTDRVCDALEDFTPISKMSFSCMDSVGFKAMFERLGRKSVVLCGIEAHVCLFNTATDLIKRGYEVHFAADATSSRRAIDKEIALRRVDAEGAKLTTSEMALFELTQNAGTKRFRDILSIIR